MGDQVNFIETRPKYTDPSLPLPLTQMIEGGRKVDHT